MSRAVMRKRFLPKYYLSQLAYCCMFICVHLTPFYLDNRSVLNKLGSHVACNERIFNVCHLGEGIRFHVHVNVQMFIALLRACIYFGLVLHLVLWKQHPTVLKSLFSSVSALKKVYFCTLLWPNTGSTLLTQHRLYNRSNFFVILFYFKTYFIFKYI